MTTQNKQITYTDSPITSINQFRNDIFHKTVTGKVAVTVGLGYFRLDVDETDPRAIPHYSITHIDSGRNIFSQPILTEDLAKLVIAALAPLADWNQSMDKLAEDEALHQQVLSTCKQTSKAYYNALNAELEEEV